ncbi:hypothetical protein ML462_08705 [Gramella lutea]|uniref:Uncharacterized protein n=1 Tax=Christiangramia lutea TaxID=1607951 RepID=A0A9X2A950_9FLAO|nr:hypothetical protein [Christiangramia lutea]MCH4823254.1 hypothetical protein [Christiangramia lutea]
MYGYQLVSVFYEDVYLDVIAMDSGDLVIMAPFFIIILSIVYLVRVKIFDRIYGIDLSELEETEISVFSSISDKDMKEVKSFQEEDDFDEIDQSNLLVEDYYRKL